MTLVTLISWAFLVLSCHAEKEAGASLRGGTSQLRRQLPFVGRISAVQLMNADKDTKVVDLVNGTVIVVSFIANMTTPSFNINAVVTGTDIKSVKFGHNLNPSIRIENSALYAFCGNAGNDFASCNTLGYGNHTVTVTPYSNASALGEAGPAVIVSFQIVATTPATPAPVAPVPMTAAPMAPVPMTAAPVAPVPMTAAPVAPVPTTAAPVPPVPMTAAPVPPVPMTAAPMAPAPVATAPTSQSTSGVSNLELIYTGRLPHASVMIIEFGKTNVVNLGSLGLPSTSTFNLNATKLGSSVNSVHFTNNGQKETALPWAYCGNSGAWFSSCSDLLAGNTVKVTIVPYPQRNQQGTPFPLLWAVIRFDDGPTQPTASPLVKAPTAAPLARAPTAAQLVPVAPTAAPLSVQAPKAPTPVTTAPTIPTQAPMVAAPVPRECDTLKGCFLRNLLTGNEVEIGTRETYSIDRSNPTDYSIRCDVNGTGITHFIKFTYDNKTQDEFPPPRWLGGDSNSGGYVAPVPYLSTCGEKTVRVQGHVWSGKCFDSVLSLTAQCDAPPTLSPVQAPVAPSPVAPAVPTSRAQNCSIPRLGGNWQWTSAHFPVAEAQGAIIGKDRVIIGGFRSGYESVSVETHAFDTTNPSATWRRMDDYPFPIGVTHAGFVVVGMKFYMCGGYAGGGIGMHTDVCMVYDHSKPPGVGQQWSLFTPLPSGGRAGGHMVYDTASNSLIFSAGATRPVAQQRSALDHTDTWMYSLSNPSAGWVAKAPIPFHGNHLSAVTAFDSTGAERHYWTGGQKEEDEHDGNIADHYEYDVVNDVWIERKLMTIPRSHHASSTRAIGCGFVVVAGCTNGGQRLSDISYYDTVSDTWTVIGNLAAPVNTPVCDIRNGILYCDTGWDSGHFAVRTSIAL